MRHSTKREMVGKTYLKSDEEGCNDNANRPQIMDVGIGGIGGYVPPSPFFIDMGTVLLF